MLLSARSCARFAHCQGICPGEAWPVPAMAGGAEGLHQQGRGSARHVAPYRRAVSLFALWLPARTFPRHRLLAEGSARAPSTATSQERL